MPQNIPAHARAAFGTHLAGALRKVVDACAFAQGQGAAAEIDAAIEELNDLPRRVLADHGSSRGRARRILARLTRIERGEPLDDEQDAAAAAAGEGAAPAARRGGQRGVLSEEQQTAARIKTHLQRGSISRAARALKNVPVADASDPAVLAKLASKHPEEPPPTPLESDVPALQITSDHLRAVLKRWRGKHGTAPGMSGLTPEHIVAAADTGVNAFSAILEWVNLMLSGKLPRHGALLDSALIGLMKPNNDVRPIAIGEVWYRFAASCALAALGHTGAALAPVQLGAGTQGGVYAAVHAVKAALAADPQAIALHMDVRNAFNLLGRDAIFAAVKRECPELLPFVQWAYGAATDLVVLGSDADPLKSATGVRQGDPLSALLYSIGVQPVVEAVAAIAPTIAYVDDTTIVARTDKLREAFPVFVDGIKADGRNLDVQPAKCALYGGNAAEAAALAEELGVQHSPDGIVCYGTPVGTPAFVAEQLSARADAIVAEVGRLMALPLQKQERWLLLKSSLAARLEHLQRTVPWDDLADSTQRVEQALVDAASAIWALDMGDDADAVRERDEARERFTLPQRHGGFGLPRATRDAADAALLSGAALAEAALADGAAACRPFNADGGVRAGFVERWQRLQARFAAACDWRDCDGELTDSVVRDVLPGAGHDVARVVGDRRGKAFLDSFDVSTERGEIMAAYLRSASSSAAAAFLNAMPVAPPTRLDDAAFQTHGRVRLALGVATTAQLPPCPCPIGDPGAFDHALVCNYTKGEAKMRHNLVTEPVCLGIRQSGGSCVHEPLYSTLARTAAAAAGAAGTKADLMGILKGGVILTDTKVIHAAAASYRRAAARTTGAAARTAEKAKWRTFRQNGGGDSGAHFVPCVVEATGYVGEEFRRLINDMGGEVQKKGGCKRTFVRRMYESVSCALARGNARMYNQGLCARLRKAGSSFQPAFDVVVSELCDE